MTKKKFIVYIIIILAAFIILFAAGSAYKIVFCAMIPFCSNPSEHSTSSNSINNTTSPSTDVSPSISQTQVISPTPTSVVNKIADLDKMIFYPVDKVTALDKAFIPKNLINLTTYNIPVTASNFQMRKEVIDDLKELFEDAKSNGINLRVVSPYRSYDTQVTTFNYWKSLELQKGLSDAQATAEANKSSAFPGHSEHQLGTTCDVISASDTTLDETATNKKVWIWLDAHLIQHGFVLSYPQGKDDKTGYVYEPWHIRWVGKDIAREIEKTDYTNPSNSNTSTTYIQKIWEQIKNN